jgi:phosphoribosylglycinamide formyltransferase 2
VVNFDFEITLLTVNAVDGVHFCAPVGHRQEDGDYRESWQPQQMSELALARAQEIAREVVLALGVTGYSA